LNLLFEQFQSFSRMAGHSKWANIKHRKGRQDAKRAKIFTRVIKELTIASRDGGPDPDTNPALRLAVQNAKGANMPKDTIERAIKKGAGGEGENLAETTYEGYGPGGVAMFITATTDNQNRTVANVRAVFNKFSGSLGTNGSLEFVFDTKGVFFIENAAMEGRDEEEFEMELIDGGADDVDRTDNGVLIYTSFEDFGNMNRKLEELGITPQSAEIQRIPNSTKEVTLDAAKTILKMIDRFEEDDDVENVFHNLELTEELQAELEND
ncbi:MAG: YebC/PmpR family DNA-binding transcriptional regulator, partial [Bacteroidota bacterium]